MQRAGHERIRRRAREADGMQGQAPNRGGRAPRAVVAVLIGAEAGAGIGLLLGDTPFAPIGLAAAGRPGRAARGGRFARGHRRVVERGIRHQLRRAHRAPTPGAATWRSTSTALARFRRVSDLEAALERARGGGPLRHHDKSREQGKLPVRERVARLVDPGSFVEDALLVSWEQDGFGADGVVTGMATIGGRPVALMANDPTVKAGSWGPKTVEKIIRIQEQALEHPTPMIYLVDSAGRASPSRSRCSPEGAAPGASSTPR